MSTSSGAPPHGDLPTEKNPERPERSGLPAFAEPARRLNVSGMPNAGSDDQAGRRAAQAFNAALDEHEGGGPAGGAPARGLAEHAAAATSRKRGDAAPTH